MPKYWNSLNKMPYNTRRFGAAGGMQNPASAVGQRRPGIPPLSNNFTSGGPNNMANKPVIQTQQQHFQLGGPMQAQLVPNPVQRPTLAQQQPPPPPLISMELKVKPEQKPNVEQKPDVEQKLNPEPPVVEEIEMTPTNADDGEEKAEETVEEVEEKKRKIHSVQAGAFRISKKELVRKRNERMRRLVQPKNALMILNELVGGTNYDITESPGNMFRCTVAVEGKEHIGIGKSKPAAKNASAELALKFLVMTKFKRPNATFAVSPIADSSVVAEPFAAVKEEGDDKMDASEEANNEGVSLTHIASYALHKLLNEWDEDGIGLTEKLAFGHQVSAAKHGGKPIEKKPAKQMPTTAATMNPIMLLNQMHPNAVYDDVERTGNPPHTLFTIKCTANDETFFGTGPNKKGARKLCAFSACMKLLGMEYSPSFLEEHGVVVDETGKVTYATKAVENL